MICRFGALSTSCPCAVLQDHTHVSFPAIFPTFMVCPLVPKSQQDCWWWADLSLPWFDLIKRSFGQLFCQQFTVCRDPLLLFNMQNIAHMFTQDSPDVQSPFGSLNTSVIFSISQLITKSFIQKLLIMRLSFILSSSFNYSLLLCILVSSSSTSCWRIIPTSSLISIMFYLTRHAWSF